MKRIFILTVGFLSLLYMARAESSALAEGENASAKAEDFVFSGHAPLEVPAKGGAEAKKLST